MPLALRQGLSFCIASDRAIFLDLKRDRYFCLSPKANGAFIALAKETCSKSERARLQNILPAELFTSEQGECVVHEPDESVVSAGSLLDQPLIAPSRIAVGHALHQLCSVAVQLKLRSLAAIIGVLQDKKFLLMQPNNRNIDATLMEVVAAHERSTLFLKRHDRCLMRSIAMSRHLLSKGIAPTLIFAVMVRPFEAHCWVQYGDHVLNDHIENVRNFTPILVI